MQNFTSKRKPRSQPGETNPAAKLTNHEVETIRTAIASGAMTQAQAAVKFDISPGHVSDIVRYRRR